MLLVHLSTSSHIEKRKAASNILTWWTGGIRKCPGVITLLPFYPDR